MKISVTVTDSGERQTFKIGPDENRVDYNANEEDCDNNTSNDKGKTTY